MFIPLLLFCIFSIISFKDISKGIIATFVFSSFLDGFIVFSNYSVYTLLIVLNIFLLFKDRRFSKTSGIGNFPLILPFILVCLANILSNVLAPISHMGSLVQRVLTLCVYIYIVWILFVNKQESSLKSLIYFARIYAIIITAYCVFEIISNSNPFVDRMSELGFYPYNYDLQMRYGIKRCYTIFPMHITNGAVSIELFCLLLFTWIRGWLSRKKTNLLIIGLLALNIFATGARSVILSFIICLLFLLSYLRRSFKIIICSAFLFCFLAIQFHDYFNEIILSFSDTSSVEGSSSEMRERQWILTYSLLQDSFFFGHGIGYISDIMDKFSYDMQGAESLWIPVLVDLGFVGAIAYATYFIAIYLFCAKSNYKPVIFIALGFTVLYIMTSVPNLAFTNFFIYILAIVTMAKYPLVKNVKHNKNLYFSSNI